MSLIDLSDHYAHFDKHITIYNFLKFSSRQWRIIDNKIQPLNRMRFVDYKSIFAKTGMPVTEEIVRKGNFDELESIKIHKEFSKYSKKDLAISHGYIVSSLSR
jgi:hypothetical protein